jgi:endonuclease YncB( thermonuclease family)
MEPGRGRRRRLPYWAGLWLAVSAFLAAPAVAEEFTGRVVGVTDGDTLTVLHARHPATVRLVGVDAPEKRQSYGDRARRFTADLAFDRTVTVRAAGRDRNGRLLGEVLLPDGRSLSQELVRAGYAWWFWKYSRDDRLARLEEEARASRRGLWADSAPQAPWDYRINVRRQGVRFPGHSSWPAVRATSVALGLVDARLPVP